MKPVVVCLCGSTKFREAFEEAQLMETLAGRIVLTVGGFPHHDGGRVRELVYGRPGVKEMLDKLHKDKIDLADEVLVLNVGGYIGESTISEVRYAWKQNKRIRLLEPTLLPECRAKLNEGLTDNARPHGERVSDTVQDVVGTGGI